MNLANPFSIDTRILFMGVWRCWICGENGQRSGGLELHHIMGRISSSPFNCALVCHGCHEHLNHNEQEEQELFLQTAKYLRLTGYIPTQYDLVFLEENKKRLFSKQFNEWLKNL